MSAEKEKGEEQSLSSQIVHGAVWTIGMRWLMRCMGLISIAILARILTPADFGIVAMVTAVIALSELLLNFGAEYAIIRNQDATRSHFDTAWTVRLIQSVGMAALIAASALPAAQFFGDDRVTELLLVAALGITIGGFSNIGVVLFRRDLNFRGDFIFVTVGRFGGVISTIVLAVVLQNYWALVLGMVARSLFSVIFSYIISAYRPRLTLSEWNEIWGFSKWNLGMGMGTYGTQWLDRVFISRFLGAEATGLYNIASELSILALNEVAGPINRVLVPGLSKLNKDPERLKEGYLKAQNATATLALPATLGIALVATELVPLLLGPQWHGAIVLMQVLWIFAASRALVTMSGNLLSISGHVRLAAILVWVEGLMFAAALYPAYLWGGIVGIAAAKGATGILAILLWGAVNRSVNGVGFRELAVMLWRPVAASLGMSAVVWALPTGFSDLLPVILAAKTIVGGLVYVAMVYLLWRIAGRPDGIETMAIAYARPLLRKVPGVRRASQTM